MARPTGWDVLGLDGDPTPGVVESVQALAKEFGDFAHDVESAYRSLNSFGSDAAALEWVGQTADAFKGQFGQLPGRLQKLYTSYSEASDALSAYAPQLQAAQSKADSALRQAQDANADLQRATTTANNAAADLKTAQQNHAASPNPQAVTDAQTAHDTAQTNLANAKARMADLTKQANDAYNDRITAAKACARALGHAQSDGIHNKSWWQHVGEDLSEWGGEIGKIAGEIAPILDIIALATSWIPGVDVVTAALAEADNIVALAGTAIGAVGDAMQGHWGDALMGAGMLALTFVGGRALGSGAEDLEGEAGALEGGAGALEGEEGAAARTAEGSGPANVEDDPVDVVSGWMLTDATDLDLPGTLPLVLRRAYASGYSTGRLFGPGWSSTLDQRISINGSGIHFAGDDAQRLDYPIPAAGEQVLPTRGTRWPLVWDRDTDEIRVEDPWSGQTRHFGVVHFSNEVGQIRDLTAITDRNGNRISILRDEQGTPTAVEHPGYKVAVDTIATAAGPRVCGLRVLDAAGADSGTVAKQFRYDDHGRLTGVVNSSGLAFTYEWDDADRIVAWRDRAGYRFGYIYDHLGRVVRGDGAFLAGSFHYDPANRTTVYTNSLCHTTTFVYDEYGHVTSETDPLGHTTFTTTDPYGRVLSRTDPLGAITRYEQDEAGDIRRVVAPDGGITHADYNAFHQIVALTHPDGVRWRREYDDRGNLVAVTDPLGGVARYEYTESGALAASIDELGAVVRVVCDAAGLPVCVTDAVGGLTRAERDAAGTVTRVTDPLGAVTVFEWNPDGRPVSRTDPDGAVTRWRHDADGRMVEHVDPIGAITVFEPGPMGLLQGRTGPDGIRQGFIYDSEMRLREVTSAAGASWTYTYDPAGHLTGETDFIGRRLGYEYDAAGRLTARITGSGQRITLERDLVGRVLARTTPEGDYSYSYDRVGRLKSVTGPGTALAYEHDALGRVLAETVDGRTMRYAYDAAGRRTSRVTASGIQSTWTFDAAGRAVDLIAGAGRLTRAFDAAGREIERLLGGAWLTRGYDAAGRLVTQQLITGDRRDHAGAFDTILNRSWAWRADGVPEEIRDSLRGTRRIATDSAGRVTAVTGQGWTESYAYDGFGNLNANTDGGAVQDFAPVEAVAANKTLTQSSGRSRYEYDEAGRLVRTVRRTLDGRRKTWEYSWDSQNRLVQADTPEHGTWRYTYDAVGRRSAKYRIGADGVVAERIVFTWDGARLVEQQSSGSDGGTVTTTWDYDPGTFRPAAQRRRTWLADADQQVVDEAFHAIVTDLVGAPTELVGADGRIAWQMSTTVWGRSVGVAGDPGVDCPLRFPGQYHDPETGLHYNLNRYYDSDIGAYISPDLLGLEPAPNDHSYVRNPLTYMDPLGLYEDPSGGPSNSIYRTPHEGDREYELENGPNPASHEMPGGDDSVYFGQKSVAGDYQGIGDYANGSIRYEMHPDFFHEFEDVKFRYDWKGPDGTPRYEWQIPTSRLDRFNELTLRRVWVPK